LHETDRLAALTREINALGGNVVEEETALHITPNPITCRCFPYLRGSPLKDSWRCLGLVVKGIEVENIATTVKPFPIFQGCGAHF